MQGDCIAKAPRSLSCVWHGCPICTSIASLIVLRSLAPLNDAQAHVNRKSHPWSIDAVIMPTDTVTAVSRHSRAGIGAHTAIQSDHHIYMCLLNVVRLHGPIHEEVGTRTVPSRDPTGQLDVDVQPFWLPSRSDVSSSTTHDHIMQLVGFAVILAFNSRSFTFPD